MSLLQTLVYQEVRGNLQLSYAPDADLENLAANTANISVSTTDLGFSAVSPTTNSSRHAGGFVVSGRSTGSGVRSGAGRCSGARHG